MAYLHPGVASHGILSWHTFIQGLLAMAYFHPGVASHGTLQKWPCMGLQLVHLYFFLVLHILSPEKVIRPIQKSPCFRSRSPWKLDSVGRIVFCYFGLFFFILCHPLIQMNTQDMHAPKHHCMQHIAKSQTRHCCIARCMWSKLRTEKN